MPTQAEGLDQLASYSNYFLGANPARWRPNVPHFRRALLKEFHPGVDVVFYGKGDQIEYNLIVASGADLSLSLISLDFSRGQRRTLSPRGDYTIETRWGSLTHGRPVVFQEGRPIQTRVRESQGHLRFEFQGYDPAKSLLVDPILGFSAITGDQTAWNGVAMDSTGDATGRTIGLPPTILTNPCPFGQHA